MDTTLDTDNQAARRAFVSTALDAANAHNILTADDRLSFGLAVLADDLAGAESWAQLVIYDLSMRCRSFTPAVLTNLVSLSRAAGAAS